MVKIAGFSIQTRTMTCQLDLTSQSGLKCHFLVLATLGVLPKISFTPLSLHPWGRLVCQKKQKDKFVSRVWATVFQPNCLHFQMLHPMIMSI